MISVLSKAANAPPTASDLNRNVPENGMEHILIADGKIDEKELRSLGLEKRFLERKLRENGYTSPEDVFFMGLDDAKNLYLIRKENACSKASGPKETAGGET